MDRIRIGVLATAIFFFAPACSEETDERIAVGLIREESYLMKTSTTSFTDDDQDGEWVLHTVFKNISCDPSEDREDITFWWDMKIIDVADIPLDLFVGLTTWSAHITTRSGFTSARGTSASSTGSIACLATMGRRSSWCRIIEASSTCSSST